MATREIEAYKTSDGKIFESYHEAKDHEETLLVNSLSDILKLRGVPLNPIKAEQDIFQRMIDNAPELLKVLSKFVHTN